MQTLFLPTMKHASVQRADTRRTIYGYRVNQYSGPLEQIVETFVLIEPNSLKYRSIFFCHLLFHILFLLFLFRYLYASATSGRKKMKEGITNML